MTPANVSIKGKNQDTSEILLANGLCCIMFKNEDFAEKICDPRAKYIDVVGKFNVNVYAGRTTYQLIIEDYNIRKRLEF